MNMSTSKQNLIEDNMNLVYFVIHKHYPTFIKDEDLVQEGFCGLCKAAEMYDESKGIAFSTYASKAILNHIKWYFTRQMKHNGVYSLDKEVLEHKDGETVTLVDLIVDESAGKGFDYVEREDFVDRLDETNQKIVDLLKEGLTHAEIGEELGLSTRVVQQRVGVIKAKWRKENGEN